MHYFRILFFSFLCLLLGCEQQGINNSTFVYMDFYGLDFHQSMAFSRGKALFFNPIGHDLICDIYDITTKTKEATLKLPLSDNFVPHANSASFSNLFYNEESAFPLLYISSWNGNREAYVYDIKYKDGAYSANLVQLIDPSQVSASIIGQGYLNWVIDIDNLRLYAIAYRLPNSDTISTGNSTHVTWFNIPEIDEQNLVVGLTDSDVMGYNYYPVINVFQDMFINNGIIYIASGFPYPYAFFENLIYRIDTNNNKFTSQRIPLNGEPEGFCFYQGKMFLYIEDGNNRVYDIDTFYSIY